LIEWGDEEDRLEKQRNSSKRIKNMKGSKKITDKYYFKIGDKVEECYEFTTVGIGDFFVTSSSLFNNITHIWDDWVERIESLHMGKPYFFVDKKINKPIYSTYNENKESVYIFDYNDQKKCRRLYLINQRECLNYVADIIKYFNNDLNKNNNLLGEIVIENEKIVFSNFLNYIDIDVKNGSHKVYKYELQLKDIINYGLCVEISI